MTLYVLKEFLLFIALAVGTVVAIMALVLLALYLGMRTTNDENRRNRAESQRDRSGIGNSNHRGSRSGSRFLKA